ncbi:unnamed protein product [Amaranthus hypochondriacus]
MGNCQAIDAATLVVQHPNGKVDQMYWPVPASEIMKINPGYYVALLITTTVCHTSPKIEPNSDPNTQKNTHKTTTTTNKTTQKNSSNTTKNTHNDKNSGTSTGDGRNTVRITRVKLLRPTDTLTLGHVYRLISSKEVMKGLVAKKQAKMRKNGIELADSEGLKEAQNFARSQQHKNHQGSRHGHRSKTASASNGGSAKPKTWQPSLHSISEAAS